MKTVASVRRKSRQAGQGMTEYIIIVALIAVAAIGVYAMFGQTIRSQTAALAAEMAGNATVSKSNIGRSENYANEATNRARQGKGLNNFNVGNDTSTGN